MEPTIKSQGDSKTVEQLGRMRTALVERGFTVLDGNEREEVWARVESARTVQTVLSLTGDMNDPVQATVSWGNRDEAAWNAKGLVVVLDEAQVPKGAPQKVKRAVGASELNLPDDVQAALDRARMDHREATLIDWFRSATGAVMVTVEARTSVGDPTLGDHMQWRFIVRPADGGGCSGGVARDWFDKGGSDA